MKNLIKYMVLICFFASCNSETQKKDFETNSEFQIPSGAFPIIYRKHLYIGGLTNNVKSVFVFDTGADNLYFDSLFFSQNKFSYKNIAVALLPGVGSKPQKIKLILDTVNFHFSGNEYNTNRVPVLGLKGILGDIADGILGGNYFSGKVLEINYQHKYMKIYDSIDAALTNGYSKIVCENVNDRLYIPLKLKINDSLVIEGKFALDLGSGGSVSLTSPVAKQFALGQKIEQKIKYYTNYGGVGGKTSRYDFRAESLLIGDFELNDIVMDYSEDKNGALSTTKNFGLLGNVILERFDLLIDFKNFFLYIKPNSHYTDVFTASRLGFTYVDRSETFAAWNLTGFYKDSPAEQSGLQIDDKITHLNDQPVTEINYEQQKELFKKAETIKLTVKRNSEILFFNVILKEVI